MAQDADGEKDQERETESGGNYIKWKIKVVCDRWSMACSWKAFTNSKLYILQVAGDKRKRVTSIKEEEEEDEDGEGGKPVKKRSSQAGASNKSLQF